MATLYGQNWTFGRQREGELRQVLVLVPGAAVDYALKLEIKSL